MADSWWGARAMNSVLDAMYDRLDLWRDKTLKEADYSKVRGFILYIAVTFIVVFISVRDKKIPAAFLISVPLGMLALAAGERTFMAFLKAWGGKVGDMTGTVEAFEPHEWANGDPNEGVI